uniref:Uncharacterized protein n=1 Tax=Anguilla anguilla TaxID=7936 RepID=A0A0E9WBY2_ANGAN
MGCFPMGGFTFLPLVGLFNFVYSVSLYCRKLGQSICKFLPKGGTHK